MRNLLISFLLLVSAMIAEAAPGPAKFPSLSLGGHTNIISDNGTAMTYNGVVIGGGGGGWTQVAVTNSTLEGVASAFGFISTNASTFYSYINITNATDLSGFNGIAMGHNALQWWGTTSTNNDGLSFISVHDTSRGDPNYNALYLALTDDSTIFDQGIDAGIDLDPVFGMDYFLRDGGASQNTIGLLLHPNDTTGVVFSQNNGLFVSTFALGFGAVDSFRGTVNTTNQNIFTLYNGGMASDTNSFSGGTNCFSVSWDSNVKAQGSYTSGAPSGGTAAAWKFGLYRTNYVQADVSGNAVNLQTGIGVTDASAASSGNVGEFISSLVASGSAVTLTNASAWNVTSISLTAGDWDVEGNINFSATTATVTGTQGGISTTSATLPTDGSEVYSGVQVTLLSEKDSVTLPRKRVNVSTTTVVYLVAKSTFSAGSVTGFGSISARRVR